jgi:hypothetical protein
MSKIISYSLWGNKAIYTINAIKNADIAIELFPDWECRYYISPNVNPKIIEELQKRKNTKLVFQKEDESWNGMFWRFYAAADVPTRNDAMISRDADSLLNKRDKACVDQWLASDKDFHIVRDNCAHNAKIMGGVWGVRNNILVNIKELINNYSRKNNNNRKNRDQEFLWDIIYPIVKNKAFIHDAYKFFDDGGVPPPIRRLGPYLPSEKPDNQDWPTLDDPYRTVKNNKLVYCGWCHRVHDNDFIGKLNQDFTEEDKEKYPFKETE